MFILIQTCCVLSMLTVWAASWIAWFQLRKFDQQCQAIRTREDLDKFKGVVKSNMFIALLMIAGVLASLSLAAVGYVVGAVSSMSIVVALCIVGPVFLIGSLVQMPVDRRVKKMEVQDDNLRSEYESVLSRWKSSALPNW